MFRFRTITSVLFLLLTTAVLFTGSLAAQDTTPNIDEYVFHMVAATRGVMPETIIRLDNNWQILNACIEAKTYEELVELEIPISQSQIQILLMWGLLEGEGNKIKTTFPVISADRTAIVRNTIKKHAADIGKEIIPEVKALVSSLTAAGAQNSAYSILYSYVLGELIWVKFAEKNIVIKGPVSIDKPYWNGKMWALTPGRENRSMVTSLDANTYSLKFHWSPKISGKVNMFMSSMQVISQMLRDMEEHHEVRTTEIIPVLAAFGLLDPEGKIIVPTIDENSSTGVYASCDALAAKVRDQFLAKVDFSELTSQAALLNEFSAFAVAFQEFCREVVPYLVSQGALSEPNVLIDPEAELGEMKELLFITKYKTR